MRIYEGPTLPIVQQLPAAPVAPAGAAPAVLPDVVATGPVVAAPGTQVPTVVYDSRVFLTGADFDRVWETAVDVVDDYFPIQEERPVGNEGVINTRPDVSATVFEPWRRSPANFRDRLESTLQSIRRFARVRVLPGDGGYWVDVAVYKELEDLAHPLRSTAGAATFRTDNAFVRVEDPIGEQETHCGWIPLGRDQLMEQEILVELQTRHGSSPLRVFTPGL